jgi:enterochelin esterase family protein
MAMRGLWQFGACRRSVFAAIASGVSDVARLCGLASIFSALLWAAACGGGAPGAPGSSAGDDAGTPGDAAGTDASIVAQDAGDAAVFADGGPDAGPPDCTRAAQARTAPPSLFDAYVGDVAKLAQQSDRDARTTKLLADVAAAGGTPLEDPSPGDRVVFLVRGAPPQGPWNVSGSFNGWTPGSTAMTQIAGTDLWAADVHIARGVAQQYKLVSGTGGAGYVEDLLARNVVWDGIDRGAPGQFNAVVHEGDADATKGRIVAWRGVPSKALGDARDVFVYVPASYDGPGCAVLPDMVVHDGNESLTRGDFAGAADTEYAAHPAESALLAFVALSDQNVRTDEYTFATATALGDAYGTFLATELVPRVEGAFRTCGAAPARGIAGASLGGLISTYLAFGASGTWGFVGAQSPSLFWDNDAMITRASQDPVVPVRFYLDNGIPGGTCGPDDNCDVTRQMAAALVTRGYDVEHVEVSGAMHDWPYWRARFPGLLARFRSGKTGCN